MKTTVNYNGAPHEIDFEEIAPAVYVYKNVLPKD